MPSCDQISTAYNLTAYSLNAFNLSDPLEFFCASLRPAIWYPRDMSSNPWKILFGWMPALSWAGFIFFMSGRPAPPPPEGFEIPHLDKIVHAGVYLVLAVLVFLPLVRRHRLSLMHAALSAFLISSVYGLTDEFHQRFNPLRTSDPADLVADALGASGIFFLRNKIASIIVRTSAP